MVTRKSESTVKPLAWDLTSSQVYVYHNYDIEEVAATEDKPMMYSYSVDVYTKQEYQDYINESSKTRQDEIELALMELASMMGG